MKQHINEIKINRQSLMHDLNVMGYSYDDGQEELDNLINWVKSLPNEIELYRLVFVDDVSEINVKTPGKHYSTDREELLQNHYHTYGYGEKKYLITVLAKKSLIDFQDTLSNNILYPNEREITLKNDGKGSKIISIQHISENLQEQETNDRVSKLLVKMVNDYGVYKTLNITGLDVIRLFDRLDNNIEIDYEMANVLLRMLWWENMLPKKVNNWKLHFDTFDGVLYWKSVTKTEIAEAMCTPFWEGNGLIPIELQYYTTIKDGEESEYHVDWYKGVEYNGKFDSIQELINWFKEWYIPVSYHQLNEFLIEARKEYAN